MSATTPAPISLAGDAAFSGPVLSDGVSLATLTMDSFAWRLLSESSKFVLQVGVQITLARLLPVEAFGLLAVAALVVNFGTRLSEMGTGPALIQRASLTATHVRVAFSLALVSGTTLSVVTWFGAPLVAAVFNTPDVVGPLRLIGLMFVFGSLGTTAESLMQRRMDYRRLLRVELVSYAAGYALVGIALALLQWGIWALAWAIVVQAAVKAAMLLLMAPHPARPCLAPREAGQLLNFGVGMTLGGLASFMAQNADTFVVARWLGTTALGFYSRAHQLMYLPIYQFSSILCLVLFPAYATIQADPARVERGYLGSVCLSALVMFPAFAVMAIVAPELMTGVLGPQWAPAAAPLRILCVAGAFYCIYTLADAVVRAMGAVYAKFLNQALYACAVFAGAQAGMGWHVAGVAAGVLCATVLAYVLMSHLSLRLTRSGWRAFFRAQWPGVVVSAVVVTIGVPVASVLRAASLQPLAVLGGTLLACGAAWTAATLVLPRQWLSATVREMIANAAAAGGRGAASLRRRYRPDPT